MRGVDLTNFEKRLKPHFHGGGRSLNAEQVARALGINLVHHKNYRPSAPKCVTERLDLLVSLGRLTYSKVYAAYQLVKGVDLAAPLPKPETPSDAELIAIDTLQEDLRYLFQTERLVSAQRLQETRGIIAITVAERMPDVIQRDLDGVPFFEYAAADQGVAA